MARPGRFDHLKAEICRLLSEGVSQAEIRKRYPGIPKGTLSGWASNPTGHIPPPPVHNPPPVLNPVANPPPRPIRPSIIPGVIDPETPLDRIKAALWDVVSSPKDQGPAVQALRELLRLEAPWLYGVTVPDAGGGEEESHEIKITRLVIDPNAEP